MEHPSAASSDLRLLSQALAASVNSVVIADAQRPDMPIVYVNHAFEQLSGYPAAEVIGRNCRFLQGPDRDQKARRDIGAALATGRSITTVLRNYRKDGRLFYNELTLSPIRDAAGTLTHFLGFQTDVTVREQAIGLTTLLQGMTQALAAVVTQAEVFDLILRDALEALSGISGTVLLVQDDHLHVAARRGHDDASIWQSGDLIGHRPSPDALRSNTPLFFSHHGDLKAAYPELESRTGGVAAVASTVLPMVQNGRPLGVIVLDFPEPHDFTQGEQHFLLTLTAQCALALDRTRLSGNLEQQVEDRTAELEAFVRFTTNVASSTDLEVLAMAASDVLREVVSGAMSGFYLIQGDAAYPLIFSSNTPPKVQALRRPGLPLQYPLIVQALEQRRTAFAEHDQGRQQSVGYASALSLTPYFRQGQPYALFATGMDRPSWSAQERAIIESVGDGLGLALERAAQAQQLTAQRDMLQAANEELEAFTYSVSHDLCTPVRHIVSFGALLRRSLPEPLSEKTQRYFNVVETAAVNLNQLIDGMLELSRTSRQPFQTAQVDLGQLLDAARQEVVLDIQQRNVTWQVAKLPLVMGDAALLRRVMGALLSNALKYTRTRQEALIEVWAEDRGRTWVVLVRDNGVGFDPRYRDKLFTVFQRLHRQEDFEGSAISLANARRIVARHGGLMTAEGQVDQGATFGFILPKAGALGRKTEL